MIYYYVNGLDYESESLEKCLEYLRQNYNDKFEGEQVINYHKIEKYCGSGNTGGKLKFKRSELKLIEYYHSLIDEDNVRNIEEYQADNQEREDINSEYYYNNKI